MKLRRAFHDNTQSNAKKAIEKTLDSLAHDSELEPKTLAVRVYVSAQVNAELRESIRDAYSGRFFDEAQLQHWQGSGVLSRELRDRLPTEEMALEKVRNEHGGKARRMVEQLAPFFHLKKLGSRKNEILTIIRDNVQAGEANAGADSAEVGSQSDP